MVWQKAHRLVLEVHLAALGSAHPDTARTHWRRPGRDRGHLRCPAPAAASVRSSFEGPHAAPSSMSAPLLSPAWGKGRARREGPAWRYIAAVGHGESADDPIALPRRRLQLSDTPRRTVPGLLAVLPVFPRHSASTYCPSCQPSRMAFSSVRLISSMARGNEPGRQLRGRKSCIDPLP